MKQRCRLSLERSMKAADAAYDEIDNYKKVEVEPGDHQAQASELAATMGAADCECAAQLSAASVIQKVDNYSEYTVTLSSKSCFQAISCGARHKL